MSVPHHPAFTFVRSQPIAALNITVDEYRHTGTGARHFHMATSDDQNVFLVGLRTVPSDSTGVAHILEHTVLCGSERFPVRDPFFMMIRRSLNTFMNAFTASDWTAYPFASVNVKDFYNLLDVYLDAVFFSRIDERDFMQEGHRVEFTTPDDPSTPLTYKGVVFNEMKGAMSNPSSVLWQTLTSALFPTTTYHFNSGGEPADIPNLTYAQLKAFYQRFYHPSNAVFMTYGNLPVADLQAQFEEKALHRFSKIDPNSTIALETALAEPIERSERYAFDEPDTTEKTHIVLGWLLGESTDLDAALAAQVLEGVLLENSASPLMRVLESTDLGGSPSPIMGLEDSQRQMVFVAGVEGSEPERADAVQALILDTLNTVAEQGVPAEMIESVLHQIELSQREVTGDGYPYGLQLMMHSLPAAIHDGDPIAVLDLEPALARLRARAADPQFIPNLIRSLLLDNPHRVRLVLTPDNTLSEQKTAAELARLAALQAGLSDAEKQAIVDGAKALADRQAEVDDISLLPTVTRADIPEHIALPVPAKEIAQPVAQTWFDRSTNGLVYLQTAIDLPALSHDELNLLPIYTGLLTELGAGSRDYVAMAEATSARTGGFGARSSIRPNVDDPHHLTSYFMFGGKALVRYTEDMVALFHEYLNAARFDETDRIRDLISQIRFRSEQSIVGSGHVHAMNVASSGMSARAKLTHESGGVAGVRRIKAMDDALDAPHALDDVAERLARLHAKIKGGLRRYNIVAEDRHFAGIERSLAAHMQHGAAVPPFHMNKVQHSVREGWIGNLAVNYCAKAYAAVPPAHEDAAALAVLGGFLRNGYLHRAIREQGGAYGGGAGFDGESASFRFYSYRDPRLSDTLNDFDQSIDWLLNTQHEGRTIDEAIFGVISSIDKPGSPAGEAKKAFNDSLHGRTPAYQQAMRARILDVTEADLKRVAETYLLPEKASVGVLAGGSKEAELRELGLHIERI
jgi:Zn-dependent M16 (insulinase) family peptidase